jgi:hypothetical protein
MCSLTRRIHGYILLEEAFFVTLSRAWGKPLSHKDNKEKDAMSEDEEVSSNDF